MASTKAVMAKKHKKKQKSKGTTVGTTRGTDEDDAVQLPNHIGMRTGLSPELESVHLSATAALDAANPHGSFGADLSSLMATAQDLFQQSSLEEFEADITSPEEYWASLPPNVRQFIKNAGANFSTDTERKAALTSIMKSLAAAKPGRIPGGFPIPDPQMLQDAPFELSYQHTQTELGRYSVQTQTTQYKTLSQKIYTHHEYKESDIHYSPTGDYTNGTGGDEDEYGSDEEEYYAEDAASPPSAGQLTGKKKNKKKKKKASQPVTQSPPIELPPPPPPLQPTHMPAPQPPPQSNPMPTQTQPRQATRPPPSSRAAGKQPMSYPASTPARTNANAPNANPPATTGAPAPRGKAAYAAHRATGGKPTPASPHVQQQQKSKLWSTNSAEERERIKEFWLGLSEEARRELVKIEKEAVLKKMKEQQKHSCSCAVCGRKRHAIEEELEVLYDAYYEELELYASYQQRYLASGGQDMPPPPPGPFPGSVEFGQDGSITYNPTYAGHRPGVRNGHGLGRQTVTKRLPGGGTVIARKGVNVDFGQKGSEFEDEEYEEDDYEEEEEEEEEDGEEEEEEEEEERRGNTPRRKQAVKGGSPGNGKSDLFNLGSNLTAAGPGNILTVADDLLKNDGQKFLEMMESLAERRMLREEEAAMSVEMDSEEDEEEEEGDEDEEDEEEEDEDEDEEEMMTEEQRVEEGKRMFSIFAARMFEQRVLQAYREKVAQERQLQLLRELEDESKAEKEKEVKKQKESQKKKEKKKLQKMAKDEEKASKAAEKAAEDAALRERQEALEEEQRKKREEERARREAQREAQKKAQEEERARKEEEKRKRLEAERERQAEQERKRREKEEKSRAERKEREEKERKLKEEKEKAAAAKREKEQAEKEERERKAIKEREEKLEREAKEKLATQQQRDRQAQAKPTAGRGTPASSTPRSSGNAVASGSASKLAHVANSAPKKILTKPQASPIAVPSSSSSSSRAPQPPLSARSAAGGMQPTPVSTQSSFSGSAVTPSTPSSIVAGYANLNQGPNGLLPTLSPRSANSFPIPHAPPPGVFGSFPPPAGLQSGAPGLAPSALPRGFGAAASVFDPPFQTRGPHVPPAIAPPGKLTGPSPLPTPASPGASFVSHVPSTAHHRRASVQEGQFGAVQRPPPPIAPIARPTINTSEEQQASGSSSRRSDSPVQKDEILGISALRADDDDIIVPSGSGRRIGVAPGSQALPEAMPPGSAIGGYAPSPWGAGPTSGGFGIARPPSAPTWAPQHPPGMPLSSQGWNPSYQNWYRPHEHSPASHTGS